VPTGDAWQISWLTKSNKERIGFLHSQVARQTLKLFSARSPIGAGIVVLCPGKECGYVFE